MLYRPLFLTSFMLADFLRRQRLLRRHPAAVLQRLQQDRLRHRLLPARQAGLALHALTSPRHRGFVAGLGCWRGERLCRTRIDRYRHAHALRRLLRRRSPARTRAPPPRRCAGLRLLRRLGAEHRLSARGCLAGTGTGVLLRPRADPQAQRGLGPEEVNRRFHAAQQQFIDHAREPAHGWLTLVREQGFAAARERIASLAEGARSRAKAMWCGSAADRRASACHDRVTTVARSRCGRGAVEVRSRCGRGAVVVRWWCGRGAVVVRWWCGGGAVVVRWWCGGAVVRWCGGAVVRWCGGAVVRWWSSDRGRNSPPQGRGQAL